jgi:hypothetical protein
MALHKESVLDPRFGDYVNHDFAEYHIATNADVGTIDVSWIDEDDPYILQIAEHPPMADNVVSKINTDYEIRLVCCSGFFYNPHLFLKLHNRPCVYK